MAWHYKQYQREQSEADRINYTLAEDHARAEKRGVWVDPEPTPPWDWRKYWTLFDTVEVITGMVVLYACGSMQLNSGVNTK